MNVPSLEGRGWGRVGERSETFPPSELRPPSADPPPPLRYREGRFSEGGAAAASLARLRSVNQIAISDIS